MPITLGHNRHGLAGALVRHLPDVSIRLSYYYRVSTLPYIDYKIVHRTIIQVYVDIRTLIGGALP